jgi:hypothetical protein
MFGRAAAASQTNNDFHLVGLDDQTVLQRRAMNTAGRSSRIPVWCPFKIRSSRGVEFRVGHRISRVLDPIRWRADNLFVGQTGRRDGTRE